MFDIQPTELGHRLIGMLSVNNATDVLRQTPDVSATQDHTELDVSQLTSVDSAGLSVLLHWVRAAAKHNKSLSLVNTSKSLTTLIAISGLSDIL